MSYLIQVKKGIKSNYQIILYHGKFFEKLGSYNFFVNKMGVKFVFINIDRVIF